MRKKSRHLQQLMEAMQPIVEANGYHLFDVVWGTSLGRRTLTVYIDKPDGVLLEDCQTLTRELSAMLDAADLIKGSYVLAVSSLGAERTLREKADYEYFKDRYVFVRCLEVIPEVKKDQVFGYLRGLTDDDGVIVETEAGQSFVIPLPQIAKARLAIKF